MRMKAGSEDEENEEDEEEEDGAVTGRGSQKTPVTAERGREAREEGKGKKTEGTKRKAKSKQWGERQTNRKRGPRVLDKKARCE